MRGAGFGLALLLQATLFGCSSQADVVYVPGEGYSESIEATTEQGSRAFLGLDEPLTLQVTRRSGPWVAADPAGLSDDSCHLVRPPEEVESAVADNVTWTADPADGVTFDGGVSQDRNRRVRFERPGTYTLIARSASWCFEPFESAPITVDVDGPEEPDPLTQYIERPWTGDLDGIVDRGFLRILTVHNPLYFSFDGKGQRGLAVEMSRLLEDHLAKQLGRTRAPTVVLIPVARDELLPGIVEGRGDIAVANVTITPEREELVAFSTPLYTGVRELVVTGPAAPSVASFDDLAQTELHLRASSSYFEHMQRFNAERESQGQEPIPVVPADEVLEDHDLLDLVNVGVLPGIVVDSHKAAFWGPVFPDVHDQLAIHDGGKIAWAIRPNNPRLEKIVDAFARTVKKGTLLGNVLLKRYLSDAQWIDDAVASEHRERFEKIRQLFQRYATMYEFDWLMIAAQGYQESQLDHSKRSSAGAVGIMQLLPSTAADPVVGIPDITKLESNIHAGAKYLAFLRDRYFSEEGIDPLDRTLLSLAAYNAGPRNVARARRKAAALGFDPDVWFGHVEVGMYRTVSGEPVSYVRNIYKYYVAYKRLNEARRARDRALERIGG